MSCVIDLFFPLRFEFIAESLLSPQTPYPSILSFLIKNLLPVLKKQIPGPAESGGVWGILGPARGVPSPRPVPVSTRKSPPPSSRCPEPRRDPSAAPAAVGAGAAPAARSDPPLRSQLQHRAGPATLCPLAGGEAGPLGTPSRRRQDPNQNARSHPRPRLAPRRAGSGLGSAVRGGAGRGRRRWSRPARGAGAGSGRSRGSVRRGPEAAGGGAGQHRGRGFRGAGRVPSARPHRRAPHRARKAAATCGTLLNAPPRLSIGGAAEASAAPIGQWAPRTAPAPRPALRARGLRPETGPSPAPAPPGPAPPAPARAQARPRFGPAPPLQAPARALARPQASVHVDFCLVSVSEVRSVQERCCSEESME
ncbi:uncharacterized protein FYW23_005669 [Sylvia borin]